MLQACADVEDLGETSYSAVLVEDVDGDGLLELVAATMNGNVYALETGAPYHPLATWAGQVGGRGGGAEAAACTVMRPWPWCRGPGRCAVRKQAWMALRFSVKRIGRVGERVAVGCAGCGLQHLE